MPASSSGSASASPIARGERVELGGIVDGLAQDGELVAAEARDGVAGADRVAQAARDGRQQLVAGRVAERVVDELEAVEVEEQQADRAQRQPGGGGAVHPLQRGVGALEQERAIRQAGQRVAHRERGQAALGPLALDRVAHGAEQHGAGRLALDEVVLRARLDGAQRQLVLAQAAEHDDGQLGARRAQRLQAGEPVRVGEREVQQHAVGGPVRDVRQRLRERHDDGHRDQPGRDLGQLLAHDQRVAARVLDQEELETRLIAPPDRAA